MDEDTPSYVQSSTSDLSDIERELISELNVQIHNYWLAINKAGDSEANSEFGRTDWFYDRDEITSEGNLATAQHVFPGSQGTHRKSKKDRNWVVFNKGLISQMRAEEGKKFKFPYHGFQFGGGRSGLLEVVAHEAEHTLYRNTIKRRSKVLGLVYHRPNALENLANDHIRSLQKFFPSSYKPVN